MTKGRKRKDAPRTPSGQLSREGRSVSQAVSPAALARTRDAVMAGLVDPLWGSELGQMHLRGEISVMQLEAGKRWTFLAQAYRKAIGAKELKSFSFEGCGGGRSDIDPDTEEGMRQTKHDIKIIDDYDRAFAAVRDGGDCVCSALDRLCAQDKHLNYVDKIHAGRGLTALMVHFGLTKRPVSA